LGSSALTTVLINPAYADLVHRVNPASASDLAEVQALIAASASATAKLYPASAYGAIVDARYVNVATLLVSGVDLNARYGVSVGQERIGVTASATYLYNYKEKVTPGASWSQFVSTAGYPVDWRLRTTFDWSHGPYDTALTLNYVDGYQDTTNKRPIGDWTTLDLTVTWRSPATTGPTKGVLVSGSIQNLLDTDPPFYNNPFGVAYDAANANPFGRICSIQISKRW